MGIEDIVTKGLTHEKILEYLPNVLSYYIQETFKQDAVHLLYPSSKEKVKNYNLSLALITYSLIRNLREDLHFSLEGVIASIKEMYKKYPDIAPYINYATDDPVEKKYQEEIYSGIAHLKEKGIKINLGIKKISGINEKVKKVLFKLKPYLKLSQDDDGRALIITTSGTNKKGSGAKDKMYKIVFKSPRLYLGM